MNVEKSAAARFELAECGDEAPGVRARAVEVAGAHRGRNHYAETARFSVVDGP